MIRQHVQTDTAPRAIGPYSQAVWAGELLYLSGQTPIDPATGKLIEGDVKAQTKRVFKNLEAVLKEAGLSFDHAIKLNVYLTDMANFSAMNEIYLKQFKAPFPARTTVAVAGLPLNADIEIELIANRNRNTPTN